MKLEPNAQGEIKQLKTLLSQSLEILNNVRGYHGMFINQDVLRIKAKSAELGVLPANQEQKRKKG